MFVPSVPPVPPVPSASETAYLAGLGRPPSKQQESRQNIKAELKLLFRICQTQWVADFIFNPEMNSLPALTAPLNMNNAISSKVVMTNVQCDNFAGPNLLDVHLTGNFVFVPSFSVGTISVGFGIQECSILCFTEWCGRSPPHTPAHFRYVRDDKEAVLLMVHQTPETDLLKFELMTQITASKRRRTFAMFAKSKLSKLLRTDRGFLHPDSVISALLMITSVLEDRPCTKCNSPTAGVCTCQVVLKPPAHPLDFSSLGDNMMTFVGAYEGLSISSLLQPGNEILSAKVGSRISVEGGEDKDLIARLSRWAISDHLKNKVESPFQSIMPCADGGSSEQEETGMQMIDMALIDGTGAMRNVDDDLMLPEVPGTFFEAIPQKSQVSIESLSDTGILVADSLDDDTMPMDRRVPEPVTEAVSSGSGDADSDDKVIDLVTKIANGAMAASRGVATVPTSVNKGSSEHSSESLTSDGSGSPAINSATQVLRPATEAAGTEKMSTRAIAIAPSATIEKTKEMDEKERRALLRKQRNREAAQRSNLRRKQKNDSLKQALKETHAKAAELRARELVLREENLKLRKLTSS